MADPIETLLKNIGTLKRLKDYVFNGDIVEVMADDELAAAREAIDKAKIAADQKSQIWSAINHLEAAHQRLKRTYYGKTSWSPPTALYRQRMVYKDQWVLCLMAVCYRAVDDVAPCRRVLNESKNAPKQTRWNGGGGHALDILHPRCIPEGIILIKNWLQGTSVPEEGLDVSRFEAVLL